MMKATILGLVLMVKGSVVTEIGGVVGGKNGVIQGYPLIPIEYSLIFTLM